MEQKVQKFRKFCFTWNNYTETSIYILDNMCTEKGKPEFMIYGKETAPLTGTIHLQGYIRFGNPRIINAIIKKLKGAHIIAANGTDEQNFEYCSKSEDYKIFGEISKEIDKNQGKRSDLITLKNEILAGKTINEICLENPMVYHQYGRTLKKIENLRMRTLFRTKMTKGIWYWGPTNVGKSHKAFENFDPKTHYVWTNDGGFWNGYEQQEIVIINDFRGGIDYNEILTLVDKWPLSVKIKGEDPIPFTSEKVIITSSLPPHLIYKKRLEEDKLDQLLRRFEVINLTSYSYTSPSFEGDDIDDEPPLNINEFESEAESNSF